jgi:hypothetical protein
MHFSDTVRGGGGILYTSTCRGNGKCDQPIGMNYCKGDCLFPKNRHRPCEPSIRAAGGAMEKKTGEECHVDGEAW